MNKSKSIFLSKKRIGKSAVFDVFLSDSKDLKLSIIMLKVLYFNPEGINSYSKKIIQQFRMINW